MALYHCTIKIGSRNKGASAVASAAYRSCKKFYNEETGKTEDYSRKDGNVYSAVLLPKNAPSEFSNPEVLWNSVQKVEKAKDAQLYREIEIAIPNELSVEERKKVVTDYVQKNFVSQGMCAQIDIHNPIKRNAKKQPVDKNGNPTRNPEEYVRNWNIHAHVMLTMRPFKENGEWDAKTKKVYDLDDKGKRIPQLDSKKVKLWEKDQGKIFDLKKATEKDIEKVIKTDKQNRKQWKFHKEDTKDWNSQKNAEIWRENWAQHCNAHLEENARIDHRSYERQGINRVATIHEGQTARRIEAEGGISDRMEYNREARKTNMLLSEQEKQLKEKGEVLHELRAGQEASRNQSGENRDHGSAERIDPGSSERDPDAPGYERRSGRSELQPDLPDRQPRAEISGFADRLSKIEGRDRAEDRGAGTAEKQQELYELDAYIAIKGAGETCDRVRGRAGAAGAGQQETEKIIIGNSIGIENARRRTQYDAETAAGIRKEQRHIAEKTDSIRDKLKDIGNRLKNGFIKALERPINDAIQKLKEQLDRKTAARQRDPGEERIMNTMSRFNQMSSNIQQQRERQNAQEARQMSSFDKYDQISREASKKASEASQDRSESSAMQKFHAAAQTAAEGREQPIESNIKYKEAYRMAREGLEAQTAWMKEHGVETYGNEPENIRFDGDYKKSFERCKEFFVNQYDLLYREGKAAQCYSETAHGERGEQYLRLNKTVFPRNRANVQPLTPEQSQNIHRGHHR